MNDYIPWKAVVVMLLGTFTVSYLVGYAVGTVEGHEQSRVIRCEKGNPTLVDYRKCIKGDNQ